MKLNVQILTSNPCYIMDLFLPSPLQKGRFQQDHCRSEVREILQKADGPLTIHCGRGGEWRQNGRFSSGIPISRSSRLWKYTAQARRNCDLGKAQQTCLVPFRVPSPGLGRKERAWEKKEITPIVPKTALRAYSAGSLRHLRRLPTRHP